MAYRNYSPAVGFLVNPNGTADFTTIQAAITAATSGKTIYISPGTYTENLTLKTGVNLTAWPSDNANVLSISSSVIIIGKSSYSGSGKVNISNITLQTNSDFALSVTGSSASEINLFGCSINCTNNTGIQYTSSSSSSTILLEYCFSNITTTGITLFAHSSAGSIRFYYGNHENTGGSSTLSTCSSGSVYGQYSGFHFPWSVTGTGQTGGGYCTFETKGTNVPCINFTSSGSTASFYYGDFNSGSGAVITIGASATMLFVYNKIASSNTNAISGTGTLTHAGNILTGGTAQYDPGLTLVAYNLDPSNATSGYILTSTGANTSPTWQAPIVPSYASGTFSPTITGSTTAGTTTYTAQEGIYIKIGDLVHISGYVTYSAATGTGTINFGGLPFAANSNANYYPALTITSNGAAFTFPAGRTALLLNAVPGSTTFQIQAYGSGVTDAPVTIANITNGFKFSGTYSV
jgi:hypothetical protein